MIYSDVLISPLNTEKAMAVSAFGVYAFLVHPSANKRLIKQAVESIFKVKVGKVNVVNTHGKTKIFKGMRGVTASHKKAFVRLTEGTINFESEVA